MLMWYLDSILTQTAKHHHFDCTFFSSCPDKSVADDVRRCGNDLCDCCMHWPKKSKGMTLLSLENRPLDDNWFFANRWLPPRDEESGQHFCELLPAKADGTPLSGERRGYPLFMQSLMTSPRLFSISIFKITYFGLLISLKEIRCRQLSCNDYEMEFMWPPVHLFWLLL